LTLVIASAMAATFPVSIATASAGASRSADQGPYGIADLGTLGGSLSAPIDINNRGDVVGVSFTAGDTALRGFVWKRGTMTDVGDLGGPQAAAASINKAGWVGGWADLRRAAPPSIFNTTSLFCNPPMEPDQAAVACRATVWRDGHLLDLGTLGGLNSAAENRGINNQGQVVGVAETATIDPTGTDGALEFHGFRWAPCRCTGRSGGTMINLGTLGDDPDSVATGINASGQVIGISVHDGSTFDGDNGTAVTWKHEHAQALGTLGGTYSLASAINDHGQIVGESALAGDQTGHATLWQHGDVIDLGTLPGDVFSEATDINAHGIIVGYSCSTTECKAVLWHNATITDLNTEVPDRAGWQLTDAQAVNSIGHVVGDGLHRDLPHAFLLTTAGAHTRHPRSHPVKARGAAGSPAR
jgi:probable HAF family extracellular repeat protein